MARDDEFKRLSPPRVYIMRMTIFLILTGFVAAILYPQVQKAFMANPGLNGLIIAVLLAGLVYAFRQVWRLFPEVNWVNSFKVAQSGDDVIKQPVLLAPMAAILGGKQGRMVLSPMSLRSLLDSLASRLDESRDLVRYLVGLLIFLGLLGTFWGLLDTVSSIATTIRALDLTAGVVALEDMKTALEAPVQGMGTAFSSSLFGLAGSLILGFLELQAGQAQNRFYNDLEDWLSSVTDIEIREGAEAIVPSYVQMDLQDIQTRLDHVSEVLDEALVPEDSPEYQSSSTIPPPAAPDGPDSSVDNLAGAVQGLVQQMREEQKVVREWAQSQADQQQEIHEVLNRLSRSAPVYEISESEQEAEPDADDETRRETTT